MIKLFDSMASLKFIKDQEDRDSKHAIGMYAKDGEYVDFNHPCDCSGPVCKPYFSPAISKIDFLFTDCVYLGGNMAE